MNAGVNQKKKESESDIAKSPSGRVCIPSSFSCPHDWNVNHEIAQTVTTANLRYMKTAVLNVNGEKETEHGCYLQSRGKDGVEKPHHRKTDKPTKSYWVGLPLTKVLCRGTMR